MSDTKALIKYMRDKLNDGPNITFSKPTVCDLVEALESAEANVTRLNKMVDWLAEKCAMHCLDKSIDDSQCSISDCDPVHCLHASADQWKEAASRAVEDSEVNG